MINPHHGGTDRVDGNVFLNSVTVKGFQAATTPGTWLYRAGVSQHAAAGYFLVFTMPSTCLFLSVSKHHMSVT